MDDWSEQAFVLKPLRVMKPNLLGFHQIDPEISGFFFFFQGTVL